METQLLIRLDAPFNRQGVTTCAELTANLPCKLPLGQQNQMKQMMSLLNVVCEKFGDCLNITAVYHAGDDEAVRRRKATVINLRTFTECLLHEYMVAPLDRLLKSKPHSKPWLAHLQTLESSIGCLGGFMADAFRCSLNPTSVDEVAELIVGKILCHLGISIDTDVVKLHLSVLCQSLEPTTLLVECILRSSIINEMLGNRLTKRLLCAVHCEDFDVAPPEHEHDVAQVLFQEYADVRMELLRSKAALRNSSLKDLIPTGIDNNVDDNDIESTGATLALLYAKPDPHRMRIKTDMVAIALKNNIAFRNVPQTFADTLNMFAKYTDIDTASIAEALDKVLTRQAFVNHTYTLEDALDEYIKETIRQDRPYCLLQLIHLIPFRLPSLLLRALCSASGKPPPLGLYVEDCC